MADEPLGPEILSTRGVPSTRRGYDKRVVDALLAEAARHWKTLAEEHRELRERVERAGGLEFLGREMAEVAREVGSILEAAKQAADGMRARAREDADRLGEESEERAAALLAEAEHQAFQLRKDAWEVGTELMHAALDEAAAIIAGGEDDALLIRAQAEKDAHSHVAGARKEANDIIRSARYEADRQLNQAREVAQQIIDRALAPDEPAGADGLPADPAAERRRRELLEEIEQLRAQRSIEAVEVFATDPMPRRRSDPEDQGIDLEGIGLSDELAAEVEQLRGTRRPEVVRIRTNEDVRYGTEDDVGTLFEALRHTDEVEPVTAEDEEKEPLSTDPFDLREQLLVPVVNGGAREVKRRIVDLQNVALDGLRGGGWEPEAGRVLRELRSALEPMIHKAGSAGARAAWPLAGVAGAMNDPGDRAGKIVGDMAAALAGKLAAALAEGSGPEIQAAAVSRVFRDWRTDMAERWSRMIATAAYHDSLLAALSDGGIDEVVGVGTGASCDRCPGREALTWVPGGEAPNGTVIPPAQLECGCTFVPAGR